MLNANEDKCNQIKHLLELDKSLTVENGLLTIEISDSEDSTDENFIKSPKRSKQQNNKLDLQNAKTPVKKFKPLTPPVKSKNKSKQVLCDETIQRDEIPPKSSSIEDNCIKQEISQSIFDDDTVSLPDLADYGVPVDELNEYANSPSFSLTQSIKIHDFTQNSKIEQQNEEENIKVDPDATIIYEKSYNSKEISPQTSQNIQLSSNTSQTSTNVETNEDFQITKILFNAWQSIKSSPNKIILLPDDKHPLEILFALDANYQEICIRLFARRTKWQRMDKFLSSINLQDLKISALKEILQSLESLEFIRTDFHFSKPLQTVLTQLTLPELKQIAKPRRIKYTKCTKQEIINAIEKFTLKQPSLGSKTTAQVIRSKAQELMGRCICLDEILQRALFKLQLLYHFPVSDIKSSYEFFLFMNNIRLGSVQLPTFSVSDTCAFENAAAFDQYASAMELYFNYCTTKDTPSSKTQANKLLGFAKEAFLKLQQISQEDQEIAPVHHQFTSEYVYGKILSMAAIDLTRFRDEVTAWLDFLLKHYRSSKHGEWYDRLAMNLQKMGKFEEAVDVTVKGLENDAIYHVDRINLSTRLIRLLKKEELRNYIGTNNLNITTPPNCSEIGRNVIEARKQHVERHQKGRIMYEEDSKLFTVEEIAIKHYARNGFPNGVHCESGVFLTLFAALFWDIIYMDLQHIPVFISDLQHIPLDFFSKQFYERRQLVIDERLKDIDENWTTDEYFQKLAVFNQEHSMKKSVHDVRFCANVLIEAASCIGRKKLSKMFARFVKDPRQFRSGMPDLFVWNIQKKQCCLIEVKSHNDVLSLKQKLWLEFLEDIDVPVELCLVNSFGEKVPKQRQLWGP